MCLFHFKAFIIFKFQFFQKSSNKFLELFKFICAFKILTNFTKNQKKILKISSNTSKGQKPS